MAVKKINEESKTFITVEIDAEGKINTNFSGNYLVLFGLLKLAEENIKQDLNPVNTKNG